MYCYGSAGEIIIDNCLVKANEHKNTGLAQWLLTIIYTVDSSLIKESLFQLALYKSYGKDENFSFILKEA